jgi:hypothetical protein
MPRGELHSPGAINAAAWSLGYAMEMASAMREAKEFWAAFQYMGIVAVPVLWVGLRVEPGGGRFASGGI